MATTKTRMRRGIGWYGRVFQYATAAGHGGVRLHARAGHPDREDDVKTLNKLPEFRRAAKKRQRRDDFNTWG